MTADPLSAYQPTRQRHQAAALAQLPQYVERLTWPRARLRELRRRKLRRLLGVARERSAWHRSRLAALDLDHFEEEQLSRIAPMSKDDLMAHFDAIVTDPRLTLRRVEEHLLGLDSDAYLLDTYHAVASGGSSGRRGVYVYDWEGWIAWYLSVIRRALQALRSGPSAPGKPILAAVLMGERATHVSSAATQTFRDLGALAWNRAPVSAPLAEQLSKLNRLQPEMLATYPSFLHQLTLAQEAGDLRIAPRLVFSSGEPLLPGTRAEVQRVWACPILNCWASSEAGGMGVGCAHGAGHHLADDLLIIEPVDGDGRPVPPGVRSSKLFVTNLFNEALPLIRFEITDELTITDAPCACGGSHRVASDVEGRLDDTFEYAGVGLVHPHIFRSRLGQERHVVEYQVRQRQRGVDVNLQSQGPVDLEQIRADLVASLARVGLAEAEVSVRSGQAFERTGVGKLKRFVPLAGQGSSVR